MCVVVLLLSCDTLPSDPTGGVCVVLLPGHVTSCCLMTVEVGVVLIVLSCWVMADIAFGPWWAVCVCVCVRSCLQVITHCLLNPWEMCVVLFYCLVSTKLPFVHDADVYNVMVFLPGHDTIIIHNTSMAQYPKHDLAQALYTKMSVLLYMAEKSNKENKTTTTRPHKIKTKVSYI